MSNNQVIEIKGGKKIRTAYAKVDLSKMYDLEEAVNLVKSTSITKFDGAVEIAINVGVDASKSDQTFRGVVSLPHGTGKHVRVAVFVKDDKVQDAIKAGADIAGGADLVEKIKGGEINFDVCIATPDMMAVIGQVAKILGPKGLMPNPKLGTVTPDFASAIKSVKAGQVQFRVSKDPIVHAGLGKTSFETGALKENILAFYNAVVKAKPSTSKGVFIKSAYLSATMGPSVRLNIASLA